MGVIVRAVGITKTFDANQRLGLSIRNGYFGRASRNSLPAPKPVLDDVTFTLLAGDSLGIGGPNGAGKSTLLRLIAGITRPTEGFLEVNANVAPLIAAGAGFHPEFTVRENIFLNGTILGARRYQLEEVFDAILAFSELSSQIETPVKNLSTGQYVRLAFAIAVHTDCDLFLIDEILGTTDADFQAKACAKIESLKKERRTFIIVSHQPDILKRLCRQVLILENGRTL